jgi:hypothetical protein
MQIADTEISPLLLCSDKMTLDTKLTKLSCGPTLV